MAGIVRARFPAVIKPDNFNRLPNDLSSYQIVLKLTKASEKLPNNQTVLKITKEPKSLKNYQSI